jgi:hypothetical protein
MFQRIVMEFWADDRGSVLAAEYLTLGTVVALGSAAGLSSVRDSVNDECAEFGKSVREVRREYAPRLPRTAAQAQVEASRTGAAAGSVAGYDDPAPVAFRAPTAATP